MSTPSTTAPEPPEHTDPAGVPAARVDGVADHTPPPTAAENSAPETAAAGAPGKAVRTAGELAGTAAREAAALLARPAPGRLRDVVPAPERVTPDATADHLLAADAVIRVSADPTALAVAEQLAALLRPATGYPLPVTDTTAPTPAGGIALDLTGDPDLGAEGYRLDVTRDGVRLTAGTAAGLFHGVQTLRQLLPADVESPTPVARRWVLPGGSILDRPRYPHRGAMLDVARHFFGVPDVLRVIDHLARHKINRLHLHLTDDQGWRIAVDSWPDLGTVGGATEVGGGPGGHYTRADYSRIVTYAAARHITVIPEIDLPGHTNAALAAYPELSPDRTAPPPYTGTEVGFSYVDPAQERTYDFVADVLGELAALTPGQWLHIGGDEAFKVPADVYAGFVERVQRIVAGLGKTVVGWHQIAPAGHVDGRILQWWGTNGDDPVTADAVRRGARLILSPGNHAYLDMKYAPDTPIGHDWAGLIDVRRAYEWDPATHLPGVPAEAVLGVEAPLWTESVTNLAEIEFMLLPRLPAIAELGWSPQGTHDWEGFRRRLAQHGPRWTRAGIAFHHAPEVPWPTDAHIPTPRPHQDVRKGPLLTPGA
ncbi:beta-N-acetylhexosaminidase [Micromonospora craniellae]|uniref:beta-N-acetylhexosaminidase n=1 Tax=Micromonospora craniellae TaxID=2294034 RepID=A0A372FR13_9ACTN|nr:beta-N-acetylhexosaminidase [Micromonospora craniellae]QOC90812.1 beta-N-acetylhexosaminidase [Micromonospora craniellae]RFS43163.1 beta-N-acetylhexosaminidase [Micromonospora craniellae]